MMESSVVYLQPVYILQHKPYRETSLILEVFSQDFGLLSVLAKGVRKQKSKTAGLLLPFARLNMSYFDRNQLKLLLDAEYVQHHDLQKLSLYCGFYVNELIQRFLHKHDPDPELFMLYQHCLQQLADSPGQQVESCLRYFELDLLQQVGYGVQLDVDALSGEPVESRLTYRYSPQQGLVADRKGNVEGQTLLMLATRQPLDSRALIQAKYLLRLMLAPFLQDKPLKSRAVLAKVMHYL